jgi:hypothetical protein
VLLTQGRDLDKHRTPSVYSTLRWNSCSGLVYLHLCGLAQAYTLCTKYIGWTVLPGQSTLIYQLTYTIQSLSEI